MKTDAFAKRLAKDTQLSPSAAADLLDRTVADLVRKLKKGQPVAVPGLGMIHPGKQAGK